VTVTTGRTRIGELVERLDPRDLERIFGQKCSIAGDNRRISTLAVDAASKFTEGRSASFASAKSYNTYPRFWRKIEGRN